MFFCCSNQPATQRLTTSAVLKQKPEPCTRHGDKPIKFICRTCLEESLLCQDCIADHREHDWIALEAFFTEELTYLLDKGESKSGKIVEDSVGRIAGKLFEYQTRIEKKMKQTIAAILFDLEKLKTRFPREGGYNFQDFTQLNNKLMSQLIRIVHNEKDSYDTIKMESTYDEIITASAENILQNLDKTRETLCGKDWEMLQDQEIQKIKSGFLAIYKKVPPSRNFYFSLTEKAKGIEVKNNKLTAVYKKQIPRGPTVMLDRFLNANLFKVGFKITKMQTHIKFFNMSTVYVGICNAFMAESFNYLDLDRPSKGAYLISSAGYTYHSKYSEYHESSAAFSFGPGDIIVVQLNIENRVVIFEKKTHLLPLLNRVEMRLGLDDKFINELRPCVMFTSNAGAEVTILNENQLQMEIDGTVVYPVEADQ